MRRSQLVPINVIWFMVALGLSFSASLALWAWLRPEMSLPFMGQSIVFSIRMPLLVMAGGLLVSVVSYAWQEVWKWINLS